VAIQGFMDRHALRARDDDWIRHCEARSAVAIQSYRFENDVGVLGK